MDTKSTVVVAIGGNALVRPDQRGTFEEQSANIQESVGALVELIRQGYRLVITHGNGPQVGNLYLRSDVAGELLTAMPLDVCVAETQGQIGYVIETALVNALRGLGLDVPVVTVLTRVEVDADDPGFADPSKPVGPFYTRAELEKKQAENPAVQYKEDSGQGFRRVVASPDPLVLLQEATIRALLASGAVVIAGGGGGIPVARASDGLFYGVEAVIDKDRTSALIASAVNADFLLILTGVEKVALNFNKPDMREVASMTLSEAAAHMAEGQFPPGSMGPKIDAAMRFAAKGGSSVITNLAGASAALAGRTGTRIVPDSFHSDSFVSGCCRKGRELVGD